MTNKKIPDFINIIPKAILLVFLFFNFWINMLALIQQDWLQYILIRTHRHFC